MTWRSTSTLRARPSCCGFWNLVIAHAWKFPQEYGAFLVINLPVRVPQLWEVVRRKDGATSSWPDWSACSEAHHRGAGTQEETTWSTTEGEKTSNPAEGYDSAIASHLAANNACSRRYDVGDFSVLTRARTKNHLNVLEAVYISVLNPVLCKQKTFVTSLTLFQRTQRTHPSRKLVDTCTRSHTNISHTHTMHTHSQHQTSHSSPCEYFFVLGSFIVPFVLPLARKGRKLHYGKKWGTSAVSSLV